MVFGVCVLAWEYACVPVCVSFLQSVLSHANSSQCEQMLASNVLGFCTTIRHLLGSSAQRRSLWRCLNCFIERNKTKDTQARSGSQEHTDTQTQTHPLLQACAI